MQLVSMRRLSLSTFWLLKPEFIQQTELLIFATKVKYFVTFVLLVRINN